MRAHKYMIIPYTTQHTRITTLFHSVLSLGRIDSFLYVSVVVFYSREHTRRVEQYLVGNDVVRVDAELGKLLHQPLRLVERQKLLRKERERERERTKDAPAS